MSKSLSALDPLAAMERSLAPLGSIGLGGTDFGKAADLYPFPTTVPVRARPIHPAIVETRTVRHPARSWGA